MRAFDSALAGRYPHHVGQWITNGRQEQMRIAMIGPFGLEHRGTIKVRALPLARELVVRGHQVLVVMPPWHDAAARPRRWAEHGVTLEYVAVKPAVPLLREVLTTRRLVRAAQDWRPDVVHVFKPKAYAGLAGWCFWHQGSGRPRLVVDEDDWEGVGGWNEVSGYSGLLKRFFAWQECWGLTHCDAVTVASHALQTLTWAQGVPPHRVHYVPNGVVKRLPGDGQRARAEYALGERPVVLLYTRFFEFEPARAVRMLTQVVKECPEVCLLVVGQALVPETDREFDALVVEAGLVDHVVRSGWVNEQRLPDVLAAANVAWFPFDDTLINRTKCSVKLLDLLAAGLPTVADAVGQIDAYIADRETGVLVPAGNELAMVRATVDLLDDPVRAGKMGLAAARQVRASFGWDTLAQEVLEAYSA